MTPFEGKSKEEISHYSYHTLWGLRHSISVPQHNITQGLSDATVPQDCLLQQQNIAKRNVLIRLFYRLFNINNYALNRYRLAAFYAIQQFNASTQQENIMQPTSKKEIPGLTQPAPVSAQGLLSTIRERLPRLWRTAKVTTPSTVATSAPSVASAAPSSTSITTSSASATAVHTEEPIDEQTFTITPDMQPHLEKLDIHKENDAVLTWSEVKKAYHKMARLTHSDKGGTNFSEIGNALESLKTLVFSNKDMPMEHSAEWDAYFHEAVVEFERRVAALQKGIIEVNAITAEVRKSTAEIRGITAEVNASVAATNASVAATNASVAETDKIIEAVNLGIAALMARLGWEDEVARQDEEPLEIDEIATKAPTPSNTTTAAPSTSSDITSGIATSRSLAASPTGEAATAAEEAPTASTIKTASAEPENTSPLSQHSMFTGDAAPSASATPVPAIVTIAERTPIDTEIHVVPK